MALELTLEQAKTCIKKNGYEIKEESPTGNGLGTKLELSNGCIINCWNTGKVNCQGKNVDVIEKILSEGISPTQTTANKEVFVVYGHDKNAKTQLEAMLRRWGLEPLILDQLPSSGQTLIEKLEEYTSQVNFGIVLATPDDIGYPKNEESKQRYRARQNVILELGMLLSKIGRKKVAILLSEAEDMERPSDIDGLIYIPFKDNVDETGVPLAKEMVKNGYEVSVEKLS